MASSSSTSSLMSKLHHDFPVQRDMMMIMSRSQAAGAAPVFCNPRYNSHLQISSFLSANYKGRLSLLGISNHGAQYRKSQRKMDATVNAIVQPGSVPLPTPPPSSHSWRGWIVGVLLSVILPLWRNKSTPFLAIKNQVDMVVETIDSVAEIIEQVAEEVEKVAEQVADQLPEGGFKNAVTCVENLAHEAAKDAHIADEFLDKVVEVENEVLKDMKSKSTK